jgi:hypothetical protein
LGDVYLEWFKVPGIVEAGRQLLGVSHVWTNGPVAAITAPHPGRHDNRSEVLNPDRWPWHRDTKDKSLANQGGGVNFLNPFCFPHPPRTVRPPCSMARTRSTARTAPSRKTAPSCRLRHPAGSVFVFAPDTVHATAPVVSEVPRYAMINSLDTRLDPAATGPHVLENWARGLRDDGLRALFAPPTEEGSR